MKSQAPSTWKVLKCMYCEHEITKALCGEWIHAEYDSDGFQWYTCTIAAEEIGYKIQIKNSDLRASPYPEELIVDNILTKYSNAPNQS